MFNWSIGVNKELEREKASYEKAIKDIREELYKKAEEREKQDRKHARVRRVAAMRENRLREEREGKSEGAKKDRQALRDHFAGQAIAALVTGKDTFDRDYLSREAYRIADAMMAARDGR